MAMRVHLGLGSNLGDATGDRIGAIAEALRRIDALDGVRVCAVSSAFESESWPSHEYPAFVNAVAVIETTLGLDALLDACKEIEVAMGRDSLAERNTPRTIDIDILLAGTEEWASERLTVPHPRMAERDFVITPLLEVDPRARWPDGSFVTRNGVRVGRVIARLGPLPGFPNPGSSGLSLDEDEESWETVFEFDSNPAVFTFTGAVPIGAKAREEGTPGQNGILGQIDGSFAESVLSQEGIPVVWEPFRPGLGSDPYGLPRRFQLKVPASQAQRARDLLTEAAAAPVDWSEAFEESGEAIGGESQIGEEERGGES